MSHHKYWNYTQTILNNKLNAILRSRKAPLKLGDVFFHFASLTNFCTSSIILFAFPSVHFAEFPCLVCVHFAVLFYRFAKLPCLLLVRSATFLCPLFCSLHNSGTSVFVALSFSSVQSVPTVPTEATTTFAMLVDSLCNKPLDILRLTSLMDMPTCMQTSDKTNCIIIPGWRLKTCDCLTDADLYVVCMCICVYKCCTCCTRPVFFYNDSELLTLA